MPTDIGTSTLISIVAALYSSVGHGGASGYLAVLSLLGFAPAVMASTALLLNILVAALSSIAYIRAGHFSWRLIAPFLIGSVPAAFIGGFLKLPPGIYYLLLAVTLFLAATRLLTSAPSAGDRSTTASAPCNTDKSMDDPYSLRCGTAEQQSASTQRELQPPKTGIGIASGAAIGLLSGIVGIGGGVFLTPLLVLMRWSASKAASAASAVFILVNSIAGLIGRSTSNQLELSINPLFILAAFAGGAAGSYFGANKFSEVTLRRVLSAVLVIAAIKLILISGILPKT